MRMGELSDRFYFALQRPKIEHFFAAQNQIMTQVIGSFRLESIRFETQTSALIDMAAISGRHHLLVSRRRPVAGVAFSGKFWSMQHDRTESHLASSSLTAKAKRKKTRS
jgi:hypothetical protein